MQFSRTQNSLARVPRSSRQALVCAVIRACGHPSLRSSGLHGSPATSSFAPLQTPRAPKVTRRLSCFLRLPRRPPRTGQSTVISYSISGEKARVEAAAEDQRVRPERQRWDVEPIAARHCRFDLPRDVRPSSSADSSPSHLKLFSCQEQQPPTIAVDFR